MNSSINKFSKIFPAVLFLLIVLFDHYIASNVEEFYFAFLGSYALYSVILVAYLFKYQDFSIFKITRVTWQKFLSWVILFAVIFYTVPYIASFVTITQNQANGNSIISRYLNTPKIYLLLLSSSMIVPIMEELLFRGLIMGSYFKNSPYYLDLILSSTLFSIYHIYSYSWNWVEFILYFTMSLLFTVVFRSGKSIYYSIIVHIIWNMIGDFPILLYVLSR